MLTRSDASNLLEFSQYKYSLQDVEEPNLYRDIYPYTDVPKIPFNHRRVPISMPKDIWITDTTFRDGQQSRAPYTTEQIVDLYKLLAKLGGDNGIIRQSEFFAVECTNDASAAGRAEVDGKHFHIFHKMTPDRLLDVYFYPFSK